MAFRLDHESEEIAETHEINVTPFIDVMLVLLIIFMVAAPLATVDISVDLPAATALQPEQPDEPVYVTLGTDLSLSLGEDPVGEGQLTEALLAAGHDADTRIYLRADESVSYGDLMGVMNQLRDGGFLKVALVAQDAGEG